MELLVVLLYIEPLVGLLYMELLVELLYGTACGATVWNCLWNYCMKPLVVLPYSVITALQ